MANAQEIKDALTLMVDVVKEIERAGSIPSGHLYGVLMAKGMTFTAYEKMLGLILSTNMVHKQGDLLVYCGPKTLEPKPEDSIVYRATIPTAPVVTEPEPEAEATPAAVETAAPAPAGEIDWKRLAERFYAGEKMTHMARELGITARDIDKQFAKMGVKGKPRSKATV